MSIKENDNRLIEKIKAGDVAAFRVMVEQYQHLAFSIAMQIVKNNEEAEEVVQDAFIKVYNNLNQFKGDAKFSSWLYKIVYNTALTSIRKKKIFSLSIETNDYQNELGTEVHQGWKEIINNDQKKYIAEALNMLSDADRLVLSLYYLAEEGLNDICKITSESKNTVKVRLHRARAKMLNELRGLLKEELNSLL